MGLKQLGKGKWSYVFQHPTLPSVAVKVNEFDHGFSAYAEFCLANPKNPYLLRIFEISSKPKGKGFHYEGPWGDLSGAEGKSSSNIIFMEKFRPASQEELQKFKAYCEELAGIKKTGNTFPHLRNYDEQLEQIHLWRSLSKQTKDRNLKQFAQWFVHYVDTKGTPDINDENIMMRGSHPVFSDPTL